MFYNRVLLTNDDGIDAPGLQVLEDIANIIAHEVWIVAPEKDQSGTSHSISIHNPLRISRKNERRFAVNGTPSDCVIIGANHLLPEPPNLILSGVNRGGNLGIETVFSGTVGAALTGSLLKIPSMALSQNFIDGHPIYWESAKTFGASVIQDLASLDWVQDGTCLNINFPACPAEQTKSIRFTSQGVGFIDGVEVITQQDPRMIPYHWLHFHRPMKNDLEGTETKAIINNYIAVTPLSFERTEKSILDRLKKSFSTSKS